MYITAVAKVLGYSYTNESRPRGQQISVARWNHVQHVAGIFVFMYIAGTFNMPTSCQ